MSWDMSEVRKIAGLQESFEQKQKQKTLTEAYDDESDDEDPDVKRAEKELKKQKIKLPSTADVDVEKDIEALAAARARGRDAKKAAKHTAHEKAESPAKEKAEQSVAVVKDEKKETPAEEKAEEAAVAKKRGKAPQEGSKSGQLRAWVKAHPGAKRSEAWAWAQTIEPPFTKAGFSTIFQTIKSRMVKECYILRHPQIKGFVLSENSAMGMYQWISESDVNSELSPVVVQTISEAQKIASYLRSFKNQLSDIERITLED